MTSTENLWAGWLRTDGHSFTFPLTWRWNERMCVNCHPQVLLGYMGLQEITVDRIWGKVSEWRGLNGLNPGPADFRGFHNCEGALTENISLVTRVGVGRALPCRAVCSGVGWLPPSRSARSPVTQPSPAGPEPGLRGKGCLPKPKRPVLLCWCSRGLFTGLNCRALLESPPRRGIKYNSERGDNSLLNSWPLRVSVASGGRVIPSSSGWFTQVHARNAGSPQENFDLVPSEPHRPVTPL